MTDDITHRYAKHLVFLAAESKIIVIITAGFFTIEAEAVDIETAHPGCFPGQQILLNLCKNAIEASRSGGHLVITVGIDGSTTEVLVADDGPGLSPTVRAQLFSPFATTKGPDGTGLGLTVSRRLARAQHGDLLLAMNDKLNRLIDAEVGEDIGQMLPGGVDGGWVTTDAVNDV